jgi:hypothetical protein
LAAWLIASFALGASMAFAAEPARVVILRSQAPDPLIDEAVIRTRGELTGVGLEAGVLFADDETLRQIPSFGAEIYGVLAFERDERYVRIRAYSPGSDAPLVQDVDTQKANVNAEVVAVRAVETLRAALLEFTKKAQAEQRALPSAVSDFAEDRPAAEPPEPPAPTSAPEPQRPPEPKRVEPPKPEPKPRPPATKRPLLRLWLGPELAVDRDAAGRPGLGAEIGGLFEPSWYVVGLSASTTFVPLSAEADAGSATVQRRTALVQFGIRAGLGSSIDVLTTLAGGFASYDVQGDANPGFHARSAVHTSGAFSLGLSSAYWFAHRVGAQLGLRLTSGTDAPVVRIDEQDVITLERPTLSVSLGLLFGAF